MNNQLLNYKIAASQRKKISLCDKKVYGYQLNELVFFLKVTLKKHTHSHHINYQLYQEKGSFQISLIYNLESGHMPGDR